MKLKSLSLLVGLSMAVTASAAQRNYVPTDGTLDYTCTAEAAEGEVTNVFNFQMLYDTNTGKSGFELISDENLKSGNGDLVYKITVSQTPGGENLAIPGCETAIIKMEEKKPEVYSTYFECDADGDAGYGTIEFNTNTFMITGEINFPEGQSSLPNPYKEDTTFKLNCGEVE